MSDPAVNLELALVAVSHNAAEIGDLLKANPELRDVYRGELAALALMLAPYLPAKEYA